MRYHPEVLLKSAAVVTNAEQHARGDQEGRSAFPRPGIFCKQVEGSPSFLRSLLCSQTFIQRTEDEEKADIQNHL